MQDSTTRIKKVQNLIGWKEQLFLFGMIIGAERWEGKVSAQTAASFLNLEQQQTLPGQ